MTASRQLCILLCTVSIAATTCNRPARHFELRRVAVDEFGGGDGAISPDGTSLLLSSRRSGSWDLWRFNISQGKWDALTTDPADELEAQWSPDGTRIAYTATKYGNKDLFVMKLADRSVARLTTDPEDDEYPNWSPDGKSIVYTGGAWNHRDFFVIPAAGGTPRRITRVSGKAGACSFHPDGRNLVCHRFDAGTGSLWLISLEDGYESPLTAGKPWDYKPTISPDARWVAFSRSEEGPSTVRIMPLDHGAPRTLASSMADDRWPNWSRKGDRLTFHRLIDRGRAVRILDKNIGAVRTLTATDEVPGQASFDPAGRRVVYSVLQHGRQLLRIRDVETGAAQTLAPGPGDSAFPRWSPDGRRIAFVYNPSTHWELATIEPDGRNFEIWTRAFRGARALNGSIDWSPDSQRIVFHSSTQPFEANIYLLDTATRQIRNLTPDAWFSENPAWTPDGKAIAFMSTRGGGWTWGFFRLPLAGGDIATLAKPDYTEKNFIRFSGSGWTTWSAYAEDGVEYVMERSPAGREASNSAAGRWARWPSYSPDSSKILFTSIEHKVEYWLADNVFAPDSPVFHQQPQPGAAAASECPATLDQADPRMSPLKMHHR